jgi:outer membrane receptor protein involved in Fe transport
MEFLMHFLPWQPVEENQHHSYGINGKWYHSATWVELSSGIDLDLTDARLKESQAEPWVSDNQPAGIHYDYQVDATTAAAWSQASWDLHPRWNLDAGARYEYTEYDYDNKASDGSPCIPEASDCRFYRPADRDDDFGDWSLNAGLLHELTPSHSVFVRLSHGFRAPQATELYRLQSGQETADLDSEELDSIELGARGVWGNLYYEIDSYYMKKKNVIFQDADRQNISGARTIHYGVDFSLRYALPWNLDLALDGTMARHEYDKDIQLLGTSPGTNINGNDIDTAPHNFGSLRLGWDISEGYRAELEWVHMDSYYLEPANQHEYDGHDLINLRMTSQLTPRLMLGLRGTNLTDEDYAERADFGFGEYRYFVGEPRALYVQLEYQLAP